MINYAHRGYKKKENTIESFINSFPYFDGIEFDVRLTKDKIPVVIHDYSLLRTHGINKIIHLSYYNDIKKYKIPLLDDILKLVKENNKKCLIDIKVKENSQFIINYLQKLCEQNYYNEKMFKCIVYTDNIIFPKKIKLLRAYHYNIPKNINLKFSGISVIINNRNTNYIKKYIKNYFDSNIHVNLYISEMLNKNSKNFIKYLIDNFSDKLSLTTDEKTTKYY